MDGRYCFSLFKRHVWHDVFLHPRYFWGMWGVCQTLGYMIKDTLSALRPEKEEKGGE